MLRTFRYLDGTIAVDIYRGEEPEFSLAEKMLTYAGEPEAGSNMKMFAGTREQFDEFYRAIKEVEGEIQTEAEMDSIEGDSQGLETEQIEEEISQAG